MTGAVGVRPFSDESPDDLRVQMAKSQWIEGMFRFGIILIFFSDRHNFNATSSNLWKTRSIGLGP